MLVVARSKVKTVQPIQRDALPIFPAWIDAQADQIESISTANHKWLAGEIRKLAQIARSLDANDPATFEDRLDAMNFVSDQKLMGSGADEGYAAAVEDMARIEQWGV